MLLGRAALMALTLLPALPVIAWGQATPDRAVSLQNQIQDWLQATVGSPATMSRSPVQVTAAGDHYDLTIVGAAPDALRITGRLTDAGRGSWAIDDVRIPSPSVFHYQLRPSKTAGASPEEVTSTLTVGEQNQRLLLDPTFATPSTWTSTAKDIALAVTGPALAQLSHIDQVVSAATMTPASDGRVNIATNSSLDGYNIKMAGQQDAQPVSIAMGRVSLVANALDISRERGLALIRTVANLGLRNTDPGSVTTPKTPANDEVAKALLIALGDLATGISFDEKVNDISITMQGLSGSLGLFSMGLASKAASGKLEAQLALAAERLTLPDLGMGNAAKLIPAKLALTPTVASVPTSAAQRIADKLANKQVPDNDDIASLFSQGPITAGIDNILLEVAGSSFAGSIKLQASSPNTVSGTGQIIGDNVDRLQQVMSSDPQTAQASPLVIFLKGIGRSEQNRLVWDMIYRDGRLLVNGQDMTALAAAGSAQPGDTQAVRPRQPQQGGSPARPPPRPTPNRQP